MSDRILEGSNSVLVRTLTDAAAGLLAKSGQLDEFIDVFRKNMMTQPEVLRNPKYARHMSEVIDRLTLRAEINGAQLDPNYTVISNHGPSPKTNGKSQHDFDDLLDLIDPPATEDVSLEDEPDTIDDILDGTSKASAVDVLSLILRKCAVDFAESRQHPFVRAFDDGSHSPHASGRYVVVGTCVGRSKKNPRAEFNANCTTQNFRKIKDASDDILVYRDGRPMSVCHEATDGGRFFVWLLHHKPGLELRFWVNVNEPGKPRSDIDSGNVRVRLTDDEQGWKRA
jgi:hypothetical protein